MIIEHVFITTLEGADAMRLAAEFLARGGFTAPGNPGSTGVNQNSLDMARGRTASRAKSIDELPQRLRLEWDRGRVTVAASMEYYYQGFVTGTSRSEPPPHSPKLRPHIELMHAVVGGLEAALSRGMSLEEAARPWVELEARLREESRRKRRRRNILMWSIVIGIFALLFLVIALTVRR